MAREDVADFDRFAGDLDGWARGAGPVANRVIAEQTNALYNLARSTAKRVTGDFAASFHHDTSGARGGTYSRRVYSDDPGGMAIEYGTAHQAPQPALSIHADAAIENVERQLTELLPGFPK